MAGDWMQIDLDLPDKAEVRLIKANTGLSTEAVVGRLISFWRWVERDAVDGVVKHANATVVADVVNAGAEFVDTLCEVGWLELTPKGAVIPGWEKRFSKAAKQRIIDAQRKSVRRLSGKPGHIADTFRTHSGQNPDTSRTNLGPKEDKEKIKRREEKKDNTPLPPFSETVVRFQEVWNAAAGVKRVRGMSDARRKSLKARVAESIDGQPWLDVLENALVERFPLKCFADGKWVPDVDWILRPDTLLKVVEGKYDWEKDQPNGKPKLKPLSEIWGNA